jgi:hypothetical protein
VKGQNQKVGSSRCDDRQEEDRSAQRSDPTIGLEFSGGCKVAYAKPATRVNGEGRVTFMIINQTCRKDPTGLLLNWGAGSGEMGGLRNAL